MTVNINNELLDHSLRRIDTDKVIEFFKRHPVALGQESICRVNNAPNPDYEMDRDDPLFGSSHPFHQFYAGNSKVKKGVYVQKFEAELHFFDVERKEDGTVSFVRGVTPQPGSVHAYYLPWDSESITSIKLPSGTAPKLFITSALSGCSVFARGDPASPVVQHAGTSNKYRGNAPLFWQRCVQLAAGRDGISDLSDMGSISKLDYMSTDNLTVKRFRYWMEAQHQQNELKVENVYKTGFVFGISVNGNWEFYLQERVTCETTELYKENKKVWRRFLGFIPYRKKVTVHSRKPRITHLPVSVRKFYPTGSFHVNLTDFSRVTS